MSKKPKLKNIINGWSNFMSRSEVTEMVAVSRGLYCIDCDYAKFSKTVKAFIKDDFTEIEGFVCDKCPSVIKCPLSAKLRSEDESCPLGNW